MVTAALLTPGHFVIPHHRRAESQSLPAAPAFAAPHTTPNTLGDALELQLQPSGVPLSTAASSAASMLGLYYVDSEGNQVSGDLFAMGSGSTYAYVVVESSLRRDLTIEEACDLVHRAIYQATYCDAYSGGQVNLYCVLSKDWEVVSGDDAQVLHQWDRGQEVQKWQCRLRVVVAVHAQGFGVWLCTWIFHQ
ncbi:hypothetical protein ACEWY4_006346 [Coilia grayii]|uniref:Proteasome subunit beta type-5 n=1 Tax=Coilia grayii TaxID=363190 RepID=A0ABD1KD58_9TELE